MKDKPKIVAIIGPTCSGKTSLSIEVARKFSGEVISADSRQVYRGLNLGTGKVTADEMGEIQHHLLDVADPMSIYTGSDFVENSRNALSKIIGRNNLPVVAGGTFFYLDLLRGRSQSAPVEPNEAFRASLSSMSNASLQEKLYTADPVRAATIDPHNRRRLIRALEIIEALGSVPPLKANESPYKWLVLGLDVPKETLHQKIKLRLHERFAAGMIDEVKRLHQSGMTYNRMEEIGLEYRYIAKYLQGELTIDEMKVTLETKIRQFSKRQLTWLKADKTIEWYPPQEREAIYRRIREFLHPTRS